MNSLERIALKGFFLRKIGGVGSNIWIFDPLLPLQISLLSITYWRLDFHFNINDPNSPHPLFSTWRFFLNQQVQTIALQRARKWIQNIDIYSRWRRMRFILASARNQRQFKTPRKPLHYSPEAFALVSFGTRNTRSEKKRRRKEEVAGEKQRS